MKALFLITKIISIFFLSILFPASAQNWTWHEVPSPSPSQYENILRGISAASPNEVWTVGSFRTSPPMAQYVSENLIMKWDGTSWNIFPVTTPGSTMNVLYDVKVISSNDIWAVGDYASGPAARPQLAHFDGNSWSQVTIPNVPNTASLRALHSFSANDIWAVGSRSGIPNQVIELPYVLRFDGNNWSEISVPHFSDGIHRFYDVHGTSSNDVWGVGRLDTICCWGYMHFLIMHWDGNLWTKHQLPPELDTITGNFTSVHAFAPDDVWVLGDNLYNVNSKVVVHWDGTSWSMMPDPGNGLDFAAVSPNELYVVGNKIKKWDGSSWNLIDTLPGITYGSLGSATVLPNGEIWAAGRSGDAAGNFYNLVYRYGPDSTTVGTSENSTLPEINIFPNPVKDELNISVSFNAEKEINIDLYNGAGQLMKEFVRMKLNSTKNEFSFSTAQLKSGIYYLKIITNEDVLVRRVVKM